MMRIISGVVALALSAILQGDTRPRFEVASVKSCGPADPGFRGGGPSQFSPNRVAINQILKGLLQQAYVAHADGRTDQAAVLRTPIEGGPDWISSERYSIDAKTPSDASQAMIMGPYLQTLLEDRFKLKIRRLTREIPTWDLVVSKSGPKLTPFPEGSCVNLPPVFPPATADPLPPGQRRCLNRTALRGANTVLDVEGMRVEDLTKLHLFLAAGRPVTDKTGLTGKFNFHMEYAPDLQRPQLNGQDLGEPTAPSIFTAIQEQLGLRLESSKGPGEYLVIDHVERPTGD